MGAYPGRVMTGVRDALATYGKISYDDLSYMIYGPSPTDADRSSMARAIRQLEQKGEVVRYFERAIDGRYAQGGMWVRRPDILHDEAPQFFDLPSKINGNGNGLHRKPEVDPRTVPVICTCFGRVIHRDLVGGACTQCVVDGQPGELAPGFPL